MWINIIGKIVVSSALPNQSWSVETGKRISADELEVCQKVYAFISYLCEKEKVV